MFIVKYSFANTNAEYFLKKRIQQWTVTRLIICIMPLITVMYQAGRVNADATRPSRCANNSSTAIPIAILWANR